MDAAGWQRLQTLFDEAVGLDPDARADWLKSLHTDDPGLIQELKRLLAAHDRPADRQISGRIERFAADTLDTDTLETGQTVGPYAIDRLLGHGGMGRVYLAHRSDQSYEQQVVIKVVQAGPGTRLVNLFERERQILADLNHPNIARLLDGGALPDGPPYLVMEYVEGVDIVSYCERSNLPLVHRLRLFLEVCAAVQYAHAKLVVHRDIKPANVLVDETGRARLLDFGIATLVTGADQPLSSAQDPTSGHPEQTLSAALLSPAYASPEQLRGEPVGTASDIYSLGLLLYRLVCGRSPENNAQEPAGIPPPSGVLKATGHSHQGRQAAGDLDSVILRALAHDPEQRHATVAAFADELERFLGQRAVESRPASLPHRLRLFTRRNPALSAVLFGASVLISGFIVGISWLAVQLGHERDQALAARATTDHVAGFMVDLFAAADPREHRGNPPDAGQLLDRGASQIEELEGPTELTATLLLRMGEAYRHIGASERADALFSKALDLTGLPRELKIDIELEQADLWREIGFLEQAETRLAGLITSLENSPTTPNALAGAYNNYGLVMDMLERPEQAETWVRKALAIDLPDSRDSRIDRLAFGNNLALALSRQGRHEEAIELLDQVIADKIVVFGGDHPSVLLSRHNQAFGFRQTGQFAKSASVLDEIRAVHVKIQGESSLAVAAIDDALANTWHDAGEFVKAEAAYRRAHAFLESHPQADPSLHAFVTNNLASLFEDRGDLAEAERWFDRSVALREALFTPESMPFLRGLMNRVRVQIQLGQLEQAGRDLATIEQALDAHHPDQTSRHLQADLLRAEWQVAAGQTEQARTTVATIKPDMVAAQSTNARFARRWEALQQALQ
jgi:serine/threonine-protein kinase